MLEPLREKNSIDRVSTTFFVAQNFPKPEYIFEKISNSDLFQNYTKKTIRKSNNINVVNNALNIHTDVVDGFFLEEFDSLGRLQNVFLFEVEPQGTKISIENRFYDSWKAYKERVIKDLIHFQQATNIELYLKGLQLSFIDEFNWIGSTRINCEEVFKKDSDLLSKNFLKAHNGATVSISQNRDKDLVQEQKVEIVLNNDIKKVLINFIFAFEFNDIKIIENNKPLPDPIQNLLDAAHANNKETLQEILSENILEKIKLTNQKSN